LADLKLNLVLAMMTRLAIIAILLLFAPRNVMCEEPQQERRKFYGRLVRVIDGDTLVVKMDEGEEFTVDVWGVDAPELGQPYGERARRYVEDLIERTRDTLPAYDLWVEERLRENDGAMLGIVRIVIGHSIPDHSRLAVGREIHFQVIRDGFGWHCKKVAPDDEELAAAEKKARQDKRGLWAAEKPMPPWEWRKTCGKNTCRRHNSQTIRRKRRRQRVAAAIRFGGAAFACPRLAGRSISCLKRGGMPK